MELIVNFATSHCGLALAHGTAPGWTPVGCWLGQTRSLKRARTSVDPCRIEQSGGNRNRSGPTRSWCPPWVAGFRVAPPRPVPSTSATRSSGLTCQGVTVLTRRVGGWYRVLEEAGWDNVGASIRGQRRWNPSSASEALGGWLEGRRSARADDYARDAVGSSRLPSPSVLSRLFGGWTEAIRSAGWSGPTAAEQRARRRRARAGTERQA
jgi:hypothetical protein